MADTETNARIAEEANKVFDRMRKRCDEEVARGAKTLDVLSIAKDAGLDIDERVLEQLDIPRHFIPHPFMGWTEYFPWKPLWSYFWGLRFPGSYAARAYLPQATAQGQAGGGGFKLAQALTGEGRLSSAMLSGFMPPLP